MKVEKGPRKVDEQRERSKMRHGHLIKELGYRISMEKETWLGNMQGKKLGYEW